MFRNVFFRSALYTGGAAEMLQKNSEKEKIPNKSPRPLSHEHGENLFPISRRLELLHLVRAVNDLGVYCRDHRIKLGRNMLAGI